MDLSMLKGKSRTVWFIACFALFAFSRAFLQSCKKVYFDMDRVKDPTWNPELAIPLIKTIVTVPEVLDRFEALPERPNI